MRYSLPFFCLTLWVMLRAQSAEACDCVEFDPEADRSWGGVVFEGEVLDSVTLYTVMHAWRPECHLATTTS